MDSLLPTLVLIVLALLGARLTFSTERAPLGPRLLFRTGTHFVLVGWLLGPAGLGMLTRDATEALFPLLALGLGWVGFHFGLQLDHRTLRHFPARHHLFAAGQALLTLAIFTVGAIIAARLAGFDGPVTLLLVFGAACTASVSTPAGIAMISATFRARGNLRDLLFFVASVDAVVGIVSMQVTYALLPPGQVEMGIAGVSQLSFVGIATGLGILCGMAVLWLTRPRPPSEELVLVLLGGCAFAAGVALQWDLSPLFVAVTMGALVANLGRSTERIQLVLARWEKAVYVTFLLLAGALLQFPTWWIFPMAGGYALLRVGAKVAAGALLGRVASREASLPLDVGLGLVPQGGISVAMAVSGVLMYSDLQLRGIDAEALLFGVIVLGVTVAELTGPLLAVRLLRRNGELPAESGFASERDGRRGANWMDRPERD